jgi:hypothetical protein
MRGSEFTGMRAEVKKHEAKDLVISDATQKLLTYDPLCMFVRIQLHVINSFRFVETLYICIVMVTYPQLFLAWQGKSLRLTPQHLLKEQLL